MSIGGFIVLVLARHVGQSIMIGHDIKVTVVAVEHDRIRIGIMAPRSLRVDREEVYLEIRQANRRAAASAPEIDKTSGPLGGSVDVSGHRKGPTIDQSFPWPE
jgi:carbon storage regulator